MDLVDPQVVIIEEGALSKLDSLLEDRKRSICVTDDYLLSEYRGALEEELGENPTWILVSQCDKNLSDLRPEGDIILGFGGGRSLDAAKLLARETGLDWISVPTAASHDGIASDVASVSHNGYRYSEKCKSPIAVLADLSIIAKAPPRLQLAGIGDIICKSSSLGEWQLAHKEKGERFDDGVFSLVESALKTVLVDDSLEALIRAEIDSGKAMRIFGSSRPCSGTEHAISHAMDRGCGELHGLQVGFATPLCLYFLNQAGYTDYDSESIHDLMVQKRLPTHLHEFSITTEHFLQDISHALNIMERRNRYSVLHHLDVDDTQLVGVLKELQY
ncbi:MAG: iron-containing alcohol dehydrogenase [Candidatus Hodarchaeota archaeon]